MKTLVEFSWNSPVLAPEHRVTFKGVSGWLLQAKWTLRDFIESTINWKNISYVVLENQLRFRQKVLSAKDEWCVSGGNRLRKNVPSRTWKRHSAFLVYRQNVANKSANQHANDRTAADSSIGQHTITESEVDLASRSRISFTVTAIKPLPVWATAHGELNLIESDVSSLRYMKITRRIKLLIRNDPVCGNSVQNDIAKAA